MSPAASCWPTGTAPETSASMANELEQLLFVYPLSSHTIARRLSRCAGREVARDFLGDAGGSCDVTDGYTRTLKGAVAAAWSEVIGLSHPLADAQDPSW